MFIVENMNKARKIWVMFFPSSAASFINWSLENDHQKKKFSFQKKKKKIQFSKKEKKYNKKTKVKRQEKFTVLSLNKRQVNLLLHMKRNSARTKINRERLITKKR